MRDENMDVPPPEEVKPDPYHKNELATAKKHFAKLDSTPSAERKSYGIKAKKTALDEAKKYRKESLEKETKEVAILQGMLDQVERWAPPTQDHVGVKSFMIQQLTDSIKHAYLQTCLGPLNFQYSRRLFAFQVPSPQCSRQESACHSWQFLVPPTAATQLKLVHRPQAGPAILEAPEYRHCLCALKVALASGQPYFR
jgi:hypothetical protein